MSNTINKPLSAEESMQLQEGYRADCEIFLRMKLHIMNSSLPSILVRADGSVETIYSDEARAMMAECDKQIRAVADRYSWMVRP